MNFFFQAEDGIRDPLWSRGLGDVYKRQMLRLQNERMTSSYLSSNREYYEYYGLTPDKLEHAKSDALIMHPGPMNRGIAVSYTHLTLPTILLV